MTRSPIDLSRQMWHLRSQRAEFLRNEERRLFSARRNESCSEYKRRAASASLVFTGRQYQRNSCHFKQIRDRDYRLLKDRSTMLMKQRRGARDSREPRTKSAVAGDHLVGRVATSDLRHRPRSTCQKLDVTTRWKRVNRRQLARVLRSVAFTRLTRAFETPENLSEEGRRALAGTARRLRLWSRDEKVDGQASRFRWRAMTGPNEKSPGHAFAVR